jgi:CheY-like chemotaxis protein
MAKTLLLADDSVTIQKVVNISFASEDVTLVTVDNGDDAVERAKETRPDLILADVVMPGKSGYEVCAAIKADPDLCHIPVLLLTGTFEAFDDERAARIGAAGHVAKPFEARALVNQVNRLLAQAPPPAPARVAPPEAVTAPAPDGAQDDDSFDFFEDDLGDLGAPEPAVASDDVGFQDSDSAFAFSDEDFTPVAPAPAREEPAPPPPPAPRVDLGAAFEDPPAPDRTVAILPEDIGPAEAPPAEPAAVEPVQVPATALTADLDNAGFEDSGDELLAVAESDSDDFFASVDPSATSDEAFDFAFESESTAPESVPAEPAVYEDRMSVGAADVAEATVLDPTGASGYDVSSADLGDPLAAEIVDTTHAGEEDAPAAQFASEEVPEAPLPAFEPPPPVATPADEARPLPDETAARADSVLAEIAPSLRESIHDTLEKIAWESFGDVTEKVVDEIVDLVEKIAWEVIPQLTETLIKEEIRRMKDETDT